MPAVRLNRAEFLQGLESVQAGLSAKELVDQCNSFVFKGGRVVTFNDEVGCRWKSGLPKEITGAVQAVPLLKLLRQLPEDEIGVEVKGGEFVVTGKRKQSGVAMDAEILLPLDGLQPPGDWEELHEDFAEAVSIAKDCTGTDEQKFVLTCVRLHPKWVEATDNYQAMRFRMRTGLSEPTMVRASAIKHVVDLGMTKVSLTENWVHFKNPAGLVLSVRRHAEEYATDLKGFFVAENGKPAVLPKGLAQACETAEIFSAENADNNVLKVELRAGKLRLRGRGVSGWYAEVRKCKYTGPDMAFLISPRILAKIAERYNDCLVSGNRIVVNSGSFSYMSCLGAVDEFEPAGVEDAEVPEEAEA
jgi:hypothetical protein